jgi:hypothetical protein
VKSQYQYAYWKVPTPELLELGAIFFQLLKYQDIWSINSLLKELCYISEAPLDVIKVEL